jgi:NagD protein
MAIAGARAALAELEPFRLDGNALVDPSQVYFQGISQGHILGATYAAISPDVRHAVLTSGGASAEWLFASTPLRRPYVLGTRALKDECRRAGLTPSAPEAADCVLLGYDTNVTYATLTDACLLVARGLPYYATHADRTCISPRGLLPDAGALIAAIEVTTGHTPVVLGKPEASMVEAGLRRLGTTVDQTLILGDQLDTDMMLGQKSGILSVLTMTGEAARRRREYESVLPDLTVAHPGELLERLQAVGALPRAGR